MITESQLRELMQNEEGQHLEFKQSLCDWKEIGEYAVGLGNEGGGRLFMGITNKKPRRIVGIKPPTEKEIQQLQRSVWDSMNIRIETELITTSEGTVLGISIPSRLPGQLFHTKDGNFLMRVGEDLRGMSQVEIAAVLKESDTGKQTPQLVDKWVSTEYIQKSGIAKDFADQGFELHWSSADKEAERVELGGWDYVIIDQRDGTKAKLKIHEHAIVGGYLVLLKRRKEPKCPDKF
jgi:predicted HTH transcriptional regulator